MMNQFFQGLWEAYAVLAVVGFPMLILVNWLSYRKEKKDLKRINRIMREEERRTKENPFLGMSDLEMRYLIKKTVDEMYEEMKEKKE